MNKLAYIVAFALGACGPAAAPAPPLAGARMGGSFTLTGEDGRVVRDSDFAGKYRLVYFGYTYCPDVCPVDVQRLMQGLNALEKTAPQKAERIQPLFVTVDPARDTPAVVREFTANFHPRLLGLTGTPEEIDQAAKAYGVFAQKSEEREPGVYLVDHTRMAVLYGPKGEPIAPIGQDGTPEKIAEELAKWVK